ncbi:MAG TPA: redoxin family protein, partial [Lacipirellulaceae bacterium]|nr:redoxin family protein [Lacipirellulaceae bacterium]
MRRFSGQAALPAAMLLAAVGIAGICGCSARSDETARAASAQPSTIASLAGQLLDLDGQPFDLHQASKGGVHVAVFVRSDCPISNRMAPEVRELCVTFQPQGVDFFLIYVDPHEKPEAIRAHLAEYQYTCPGLRDPKHALVAEVGATVTPEAAVFDGNWNIVYRGRINDQFEDFGKSREKPT